MRPFIGIVFSINDYNYFAPLTSPKKKHLHMKNQLDFLKINEGKWGAINFNNMIPVPNDCLTRVELNDLPTDDKAEKSYKNLLRNQLYWCNSNKNQILKKATTLYWLLDNGRLSESIINRCCDYKLDEQLCDDYSQKFLNWTDDNRHNTFDLV